MAATTDAPLAGTLVIDLTRVLAGPYCTMMLRDLGARVIKVERPGTGDDARHIGPFVNGQSIYFASLNRGKESIALDLKDADDRGRFHALLAKADILVENYRGGTMEKLGLGWEDLQARYPRLIYAAVSGFGHTGPYARKPAYDMVVQGMGGIMSLTGHPGGPPTRVGTSIGDLAAGLFGLSGVLSALLLRERTGKGRKVDIGMLDCQVALLENAIARYTATGEVPGPLGARHPSIAPFAAFRASDAPVIIAAGNDALFEALSKVLGRQGLPRDPRFATNKARCDNVADLTAEIESALADATVDAWLERLEAAGIPCGPLNDVAQVLSDPHVLARNMVVTAEDAQAGSLTMAGNPMKFSDVADPQTREPVPALDQHRDAILAELAAKD
jgi:CoA:oxalate CoA-transferase